MSEGVDEDRSPGPYYPPVSDPLRAPWDPAQEPEGRRRSRPGGRDHLPRQSWLGRFVATWGWRAYAIPILSVLTVLVVADALRGPAPVDPGPTAGPVTGDLPVTAPDVLPESGNLPDGGPYTETGQGTYRTVRGIGRQVGRSERVATYTVDIENGIDTADFGGDESVGRMVEATLGNPKSWTADGAVAFRRVDSGEPTMRVSLATPTTVHERCGYDIKLESSCYNSDDQRVYLNLSRWVRGARAFQGDIGSYRQYVVNHEVGHAIGHPLHEPCRAEGALAPVMMQQTFGVANRDIHSLDPLGVVPDNELTCRYNAWPFPDGAPRR